MVREGGVYHSKGERFTGRADFGGDSAGVAEQLDGSVILSVRTGSRLALEARTVQYSQIGYDAPHIWTATRLRVACNGEVEVVAADSTVPRVAAYVDDRKVRTTAQSPDLRGFIEGGGRTPPWFGGGRLTSDCEVFSVHVRGRGVRQAPTLGCDELIASGGLGPRLV